MTAEQLSVCDGLDPEAACTTEGFVGQCRDGVCLQIFCGDGLVTGNEDCDGAVPDGMDCTSLGYYDAKPLGCLGSCAWDLSKCTGKCNDGTFEPEHEVCDTAPPAGTCIDYGFEAGRLGCTDFCAPGFDACREIGFVRLANVTGSFRRSPWFIDSNHFFYSEDNRGIVEYESGVETVTPTPRVIANFWGSAPNNIYAVGAFGVIMHYDGTNWSTVIGESVQGNVLGPIWGAAANDIYTAGGNERLLHSVDGVTWTPETTPAPVGSPSTFAGMWGASANDIRVVGTANRVLRKQNGTWAAESMSACTTSATANFRGIWGASASDVYIVGEDNIAVTPIMCHFNGSTWSAVPLPFSSGRLQGIYGRGPNDIFVSGARGDGQVDKPSVVLYFDGSNWWDLEVATFGNLIAINGTGASVVLAGANGSLLRYAGAA